MTSTKPSLMIAVMNLMLPKPGMVGVLVLPSWRWSTRPRRGRVTRRSFIIHFKVCIAAVSLRSLWTSFLINFHQVLQLLVLSCLGFVLPTLTFKTARDNARFGPPERFQEVCEALLEDLEEQMMRLKIDMEGRPAQMITRAVNKKRSETVDKIHQHAIDMNVKVGKVRDCYLVLKALLSFSYLPQ